MNHDWGNEIKGLNSWESGPYSIFLTSQTALQKQLLQSVGLQISLFVTGPNEIYLTKEKQVPEKAIHSWIKWMNSSYSWETRRQYAIEICKFLNFHHSKGLSFDLANDLSITAYREGRLSPGGGLTSKRSWAKCASAIKNFYQYLLQRRYIDVLPYSVINNRSILNLRTIPSGIDREALSKEAWQTFLHLGLLGLRSRTKKEPRWPERDSSMAILMLTTGLRVGEVSKLLVTDLKAAIENEGLLPVEAVAKNERHRFIRIPETTIRRLKLYIETERRLQVSTGVEHKAMTAPEADLFVIEEFAGGRITGRSGKDTWSGRIERLPREVRNIAVRLSETGHKEPDALFLTSHGRQGLGTAGIHKVFQRANSRTKQITPDWRTVTPHDLRRAYANVVVDAVTRVNLSLAETQDSTSVADFLARDPLSVAQRALGHASPDTTAIYLDSTYRLPHAISQELDSWSDGTE